MCEKSEFSVCYREAYMSGFKDGLATGKQLSEEHKTSEALNASKEWFKILVNNLSTLNKKEAPVRPNTREEEELYYEQE